MIKDIKYVYIRWSFISDMLAVIESTKCHGKYSGTLELFQSAQKLPIGECRKKSEV